MREMKKKCTSSGDQSTVQDKATEDKISNLPNELLIRILSLLSTDDTIVTSALSKKWASLWKQVEHLRFDDRNHYNNRFGEYILQALFSYSNRDVKSLTISASHHCEPFDLSSWIQMAFLQNVPKLVLRLNNLSVPVTITPQVLQRSNRLKILKLMGNINLDLSNNFVNLDCLRELHLYHVKFDDVFSVISLLAGCSKIEVLVMQFFMSSGVQTLTVNLPNLQRLTLGSINCTEESIVLATPYLVYLNIRGLDGFQFFEFDDTPSVEEAKIGDIEENMDGNLLDATTSAKCLSLTSTISYPAGTVFNQLVSLEIDTKSDKWPLLLSFMLISSPNLQNLKVIGGIYIRGPAQWNPPVGVARCLLLHLETIEWYAFAWDGEDDMAVAKYILENGSQLGKAVFKTYVPIAQRQQARSEARAQLESTEKASPSCDLMFTDLSYSKYEGNDDQDLDANGFIK